MFDAQRNRLLATLDAAHDTYYRAEIFSGPSLHFHIRSLEASRARDFERFSEYAYALLTSWGMHRMGSGGSKMREFNEFSDSLSHVWPIAMQLQDRTPYNLNTSDWDNLKLVFSKIRCMASGTSLVGNSKIMAHLLPNLIPPVDRQYTLKFLFGNAQIKNGIDLEWHKLLLILGNFFYPIVRSQIFQSKIEKWNAQGGQFRWDTSPLKMVDNLIIGLSKMPKFPEQTSATATL